MYHVLPVQVLNLWERPPLGLLELAATDVVPSGSGDGAAAGQAIQISLGNDGESDGPEVLPSRNLANGKQQRLDRRPQLVTCDSLTSRDSGLGSSADDAERAGWRWRTLLMGMFDETTRIELCMPPVVYRGALREEFTAWVRQTSRDADPLWGVDAPSIDA